jgi:hypothetical protein
MVLPRTACAIALTASAACAPSGEAAASADPEKECSVAVRFGSYAMGIDGKAAGEVDRILAGHATVLSVDRLGGGREGEYALCIRTRSAAGADRLFDEIRAVLPARPRGPITIEAGSRRFAAPER